MEPVNAVVVKGVSKSFGQVAAVEDSSFVVPRGAVTALLGPNGAGKTTTLRMILGLARPSSGTIEYSGGSAPRIGASLDGGWGSGHVSAAADYAYVSRVLGVSRTHANEIREFVGLKPDDMNKPVTKFSTGMRQRYGLAVALLGNPDLLVLDEPVNGLDPEGIPWLRGVIRTFADNGVTVLLSSHLLGEVEHVADHLLVVNQTLRYAGPVSELGIGTDHDLEDQYFSLVGVRSAS